ncbi:40S ribosomal protein S8 [Lemmus lemmus]
MGISQDNWHKCHKTGGKRKPYHKKRKYELERPAANTNIGPHCIHTVRGSECCTRKTRIIDVFCNASNNELVRTKTLVKNCIVLIDSTPYRQGYESHYALPLGRKKGAKKFRRNTMKGKRTPRSAVFWRSSSSRASFWPVSPQVQASVAEQMAMC